MATPPDSSPDNEDQQNEQTPNPPTSFSSSPKAELSTPATPPYATTTDAPSSSTLPPEAQGEANGGPLGCCLGVMIGLLLSLVIIVLSRFYATELAQVFSTWLSTVVRITTIIVAIVAIIICGYFGWKIGKRAYREYDPPIIKRRTRAVQSQARKSRS